MTTTIITTETVENSDLETVEQHRLYRIDTDELTICTTTAPGWVEQPLAQHGEWWDLNGGGVPLDGLGELRDFSRALYADGNFDEACRDELLEATEGVVTLWGRLSDEAASMGLTVRDGEIVLATNEAGGDESIIRRTAGGADICEGGVRVALTDSSTIAELLRGMTPTTYRLTASVEDRNGARVAATPPEFLGEFYGVEYATIAAAREALEDARGDADDNGCDASLVLQIDTAEG